MTSKTETADYVAMLRRMTRALGKRLEDGDPADVADAVKLLDELEQTIRTSVTGMRERSGFSWAQLGDELGVSRQAAHKRWSPRTELLSRLEDN